VRPGNYQGLKFSAEGLAFKTHKYDLRTVERLLTDYRRLVDQTLPLVIGQKTLTARLRSQVRYEVSFSAGSWITILEFVWEHREALAAIAATDGGLHSLAGRIAKLIDAVLSFRRRYEDLLSKGEKPTIQLASDNRISIPINIQNNDTGGAPIVVSPVVIIAADATRSALDDTINAIDGEQVSRLSLTAERTSAVITHDDQRLTGPLREELPQTITVLGRLNVVAFDSRRGQLITPGGRYPVSWDDHLRKQIQQYADTDGIEFITKPIIDNRRFREEPIALHILKCSQPQQPLLDPDERHSH